MPKIEVRRDPDAPLLRDQVEGVIALATDLPAGSGRCFHLNQSGEIADFIETRFLNEPRAGEPRWLLTLNGTPLALPHTTREQLRPLLAAVLPPNTQGTMVLTMTYPETDEE